MVRRRPPDGSRVAGCWLCRLDRDDGAGEERAADEEKGEDSALYVPADGFLTVFPDGPGTE
jgi:hypothetical protein